MSWVEGSLIARGATAVVRRGAPGSAVKVFNPGFPAEAIREEAEGSALAFAAGRPTPELLSADPERGELVYAYIPGKSLDRVAPRLGARRTGQLLADMLLSVGAVRRGDGSDTRVPPVHERLREQIGRSSAPAAFTEAALEDLERLPAGDALLHLDLHLRNVLWSEGPVIIDWSNTAWGPPAADLARSRLLLEHSPFYVPRLVRPGVRVFIRRVAAAFEERIRREAPGVWEESDAWALVLAAARFEGHVADEERRAILARWGR